ncbi:hypothetical protein BJX64DRAFT_255481 [Aspergillus heterothallicus]
MIQFSPLQYSSLLFHTGDQRAISLVSTDFPHDNTKPLVLSAALNTANNDLPPLESKVGVKNFNNVGVSNQGFVPLAAESEIGIRCLIDTASHAGHDGSDLFVCSNPRSLTKEGIRVEPQHEPVRTSNWPAILSILLLNVGVRMGTCALSTMNLQETAAKV